MARFVGVVALTLLGQEALATRMAGPNARKCPKVMAAGVCRGSSTKQYVLERLAGFQPSDLACIQPWCDGGKADCCTALKTLASVMKGESPKTLNMDQEKFDKLAMVIAGGGGGAAPAPAPAKPATPAPTTAKAPVKPHVPAAGGLPPVDEAKCMKKKIKAITVCKDPAQTKYLIESLKGYANDDILCIPIWAKSGKATCQKTIDGVREKITGENAVTLYITDEEYAKMLAITA